MIQRESACVSSRELEERIVSCLPAATFEMETLCRLAGIRASREVPTAAITCEYRPAMLLNPDFVAKHCERDEHLFLLVMHELWHVLLAHTRMVPRATPEENVAFDAIINAGLARQFPDPIYRGFFEELNPANQFPALLLRPPRGWPDSPSYANLPGPKATSRVLRALYPPAGRSSVMPTCEEILQLLRRKGTKGGKKSRPAAGKDPILVGSHGDPENDRRVLEDRMFGDIVRRIVSRWPPPPFPVGGRDAGAETRNWLAALGPAPDAARAEFARVLRRVLGPGRGQLRVRARRETVETIGMGVIPNGYDRLAPARRRLGFPRTLWAQRGPVRARIPDDPSTAHVYLDVSGSMQELLPHLLGLLLPYAECGAARVYQFSTVVCPTTLPALRRGNLTTTLGTDVNPVLEHLLAQRRVRRSLVLTDGYTGPARQDLAARLRERGVAIHAVLPAESAWKKDLAPISTSLTVLPPLRGAESPWRI